MRRDHRETVRKTEGACRRLAQSSGGKRGRVPKLEGVEIGFTTREPQDEAGASARRTGSLHFLCVRTEGAVASGLRRGGGGADGNRPVGWHPREEERWEKSRTVSPRWSARLHPTDGNQSHEPQEIRVGKPRSKGRAGRDHGGRGVLAYGVPAGLEVCQNEDAGVKQAHSPGEIPRGAPLKARSSGDRAGHSQGPRGQGGRREVLRASAPSREGDPRGHRRELTVRPEPPQV